jgi:predicted Rossmann fold nucleotide-binding protein DprA/Smf involved in DNA uptake
MPFPRAMNATSIKPEDSAYPPGLLEKFQDRPSIATVGSLDLLNCRTVAIFCSIKCPGDVILRTYDLIRAMRDAGVPTIGGFHSPMEKECLTLLLRGSQPVIVCPARSIGEMRIPSAWKLPLAERRLLILSPFAEKDRRVTGETSQTRNRFVTALADQTVVTHAAPGSRTEALCRQSLTWGKPVWTIASSENENLLAMGAKPLEPGELATLGLALGKLE